MSLKNPQNNPVRKQAPGRPRTLTRKIADDLGITGINGSSGGRDYSRGSRSVQRYALDRPMTPLARQVLINTICRELKISRRQITNPDILETLKKRRRDWLNTELPKPVSILSHALDAGIDRTKWRTPAEIYAKRKGGRWPK